MQYVCGDSRNEFWGRQNVSSSVGNFMRDWNLIEVAMTGEVDVESRGTVLDTQLISLLQSLVVRFLSMYSAVSVLAELRLS